MKIIDLTHLISHDMPVYPGTEPPAVTIPCTIEKNGYKESRITLYSHTGTHIDAPAHIIEGQPSIEDLPVKNFTGNASVLDLTSIDKQEIEIEDLQPFLPLIEKSSFILLNTGWYKLWGKDEYFKNYPVLTIETADWITRYNLKGVGFDYISADKADAHALPVHKILLKNNILIIENLTNLEALPGTGFTFHCFPLKLQNGDGSPIRAVGIIP